MESADDCYVSVSEAQNALQENGRNVYGAISARPRTQI
jgi:hypothetical protein